MGTDVAINPEEEVKNELRSALYSKWLGDNRNSNLIFYFDDRNWIFVI